MTYGLVCVQCAVDYRLQTRPHVVVAHYNGGQLMACEGPCAIANSGSADGGQGEHPVPLSERIAEWDAGA